MIIRYERDNPTYRRLPQRLAAHSYPLLRLARTFLFSNVFYIHRTGKGEQTLLIESISFEKYSSFVESVTWYIFSNN